MNEKLYSKVTQFLNTVLYVIIRVRMRNYVLSIVNQIFLNHIKLQYLFRTRILTHELYEYLETVSIGYGVTIVYVL